MSSSLRLNANKQDFLKSISNHNDIFLFLSYSFEIETKDTFIHSRNFVENHIRFQIKMGKVYTRFNVSGMELLLSRVIFAHRIIPMRKNLT